MAHEFRHEGSQKSALVFRQKVISGKSQLFGKQLAVFAAAVLLIAFELTGAKAQKSTVYKMLEVDDENHKLLEKTCTVCHKEEKWRFFLVASPTEEDLKEAFNKLSKSDSDKAEKNDRPANAHIEVVCLFCHATQPQPDIPPEQLVMRTINGIGVKESDGSDHCRLCHPAGADKHFNVFGENGYPKDDLISAGLKVGPEGPMCVTCHDMHDELAEPKSLKPEFLKFFSTSKFSNVHGNKAGCLACHPNFPKEKSKPSFVSKDMDALCSRCHNPRDHETIHPLNIKGSEQTFPFDFLNFPRSKEGDLQCVTCHDEPCHNRVNPDNRAMLRHGPYPVKVAFCYKCHPQAGVGSLNPHNQLDGEGNVIMSVCNFCHKSKSVKEIKADDLDYIKSPVELCVKCHDTGPHPTTNHLVVMSQKREQQKNKYEERHNVILPLGPEGQIVCSTCHNPHSKGVLSGEAALGAGEENQWRVPSFAELCTPCHARYD